PLLKFSPLQHRADDHGETVLIRCPPNVVLLEQHFRCAIDSMLTDDRSHHDRPTTRRHGSQRALNGNSKISQPYAPGAVYQNVARIDIQVKDLVLLMCVIESLCSAQCDVKYPIE